MWSFTLAGGKRTSPLSVFATDHHWAAFQSCSRSLAAESEKAVREYGIATIRQTADNQFIVAYRRKIAAQRWGEAMEVNRCKSWRFHVYIYTWHIQDVWIFSRSLFTPQGFHPRHCKTGTILESKMISFHFIPCDFMNHMAVMNATTA